MSPPRHILISGMFDMSNFGDLMFPIVASHELTRRGLCVQALSPTGADTGLRDAFHSRPVQDAFNQALACDGMLIGGGYIVHTHRMDPLREYREGGIGAAVGPAMWLGITLAAALRDVPVAWNAPGVPHPLRPGVRSLAAAAFAAADYLSMRDKESIRMAGLADAPQSMVVPDTILGLQSVWPRADLAGDFERLCSRFGLVRQDGILACHVRRRSLGGMLIDDFAEALAGVCRQEHLTPVMIGLGTAHADDRIARELTAALRQKGVAAAALDRPDGLREIAALITNARLYAGSSLHGYIAAAAYGVPGLLVARPAYRKFDGLISHLQRPQDLMPGWPEALAALPEALKTPPTPLLSCLVERLSEHWDAIADAFSAGPAPKRRARLDFAANAISAGLGQGGLNWAMTPFTTAKNRAASLVSEDLRDTDPF